MVRRFVERVENEVEAGLIGASHREATEGLEKSGEQCGGFGSGFLLEGFQSAAAELFRHWIGTERFEDGGKFVESGGDGAPCSTVLVVDAADLIQKDIARFAAGGVGTGGRKLSERMLESNDGNAPDVRAAHNGGFFARRKFQPEFLDQFFAIGVGGPGGRKG